MAGCPSERVRAIANIVGGGQLALLKVGNKCSPCVSSSYVSCDGLGSGLGCLMVGAGPGGIAVLPAAPKQRAEKLHPTRALCLSTCCLACGRPGHWGQQGPVRQPCWVGPLVFTA